jgi:hypothetical protein
LQLLEVLREIPGDLSWPRQTSASTYTDSTIDHIPGELNHSDECRELNSSYLFLIGGGKMNIMFALIINFCMKTGQISLKENDLRDDF